MPDNAPNPSATRARILVVVAHLALLPLLIVFLSAWRGNLAGAAVFYTDGGVLMHPVVLLLLVQMGAGAALAAVHITRPVPVLLFFVGPCLAIAAGHSNRRASNCCSPVVGGH
ncbi:hypothetical protein ACFL6C_01145 [Myxococcota bacterium]